MISGSYFANSVFCVKITLSTRPLGDVGENKVADRTEEMR